MLTESFLPMSVEASGDNTSDHRPSYDWTPGCKPQQMCRECSEDSFGGCSKDVSLSLMEEKENADGLSSSTSVLLSSVSTISEKSMFDFVYKRKNQKVSANMERMGNCSLAACNDAPSIAEKDHLHPINPCTEPETVNGSGEPSLRRRHRIVDVDSVHDSCSSKSNTEVGECSSSSVIIGTEGSDDVPLLSERDICVSILRSEGLIEKAAPSSPSNTSMNVINNISNCCSNSRSCKICGRSDKATEMLICDHCEEAFHLNCCNPRVKRVEEDDDWFCGSCSKKKHILVKQRSTIRSALINCEISRSKDDESSPISLMLQDSEPYTTSVRVGKGFQAEVPDWTGPVTMNADMIGEPIELDPSDYNNFNERNSDRVSKLSTIGNWLQCRQVIDDAREGIDGTMCGKWRRAPLFEVQKDNWECFCSVFWDPSHADCAVPQELETDEVLKQLKYIELLRPRLSAKRRKLGVDGSQDTRRLNG